MVGDFLYVVERAWTEQKMGLIFMLRGDTLYRFAYYSILTFFKVWIEPNKYDVDSNSFVFLLNSQRFRSFELRNVPDFLIDFRLSFHFWKAEEKKPDAMSCVLGEYWIPFAFRSSSSCQPSSGFLPSSRTLSQQYQFPTLFLLHFRVTQKSKWGISYRLGIVKV